MPASLKIKRSIENDIWKIQFFLDISTLPESDKELMRKFGEPQINAGGSFGAAPNNYILPDKWIKVKSDLPYTQEFDSKSLLFATNTQIKAEAYQAAFKDAYAYAFTELRMKADTFTGEEIYNVITTTPVLPVITSTLTASATVGTAFTYQIVASNGPREYTATNLPAGLSLNTATGAITGTLTTTGVTTATIGAKNLAGTGTASLVITAVAVPVITSTLTASATKDVQFTYQIVATNTPISYSATGLPAGLAVNTSTGAITGTPTATGSANVTIGATNTGGEITATLVLTVRPQAPSITSDLTVNANVDTLFSYQIEATNNPTAYAATNLPDGLEIDTATGEITGTPTTEEVVTATISATNAGGTDTENLVITVLVQAPSITSDLTVDANVDTAFTYQIEATNNPTEYAATDLPDGLSIDPNTGLITGTPTTEDIVTASISATNDGGTATEDLVFTVLPHAPVITSTLTRNIILDAAFTYTIAATYTPTSYSATPLPAGLSIDIDTGIITGTPSALGTTTVTIGATNAGGTDTKALVITVAEVPVVSSVATAAATVGTAFKYTITASNGPTSYNATDLPAWLTVDTANGEVTGTPAVGDIGNVAINVSATNIVGTGTKAVTITVAAS